MTLLCVDHMTILCKATRVHAHTTREHVHTHTHAEWTELNDHCILSVLRKHQAKASPWPLLLSLGRLYVPHAANNS